MKKFCIDKSITNKRSEFPTDFIKAQTYLTFSCNFWSDFYWLHPVDSSIPFSARMSAKTNLTPSDGIHLNNYSIYHDIIPYPQFTRIHIRNFYQILLK